MVSILISLFFYLYMKLLISHVVFGRPLKKCGVPSPPSFLLLQFQCEAGVRNTILICSLFFLLEELSLFSYLNIVLMESQVALLKNEKDKFFAMIKY